MLNSVSGEGLVGSMALRIKVVGQVRESYLGMLSAERLGAHQLIRPMWRRDLPIPLSRLYAFVSHTRSNSDNFTIKSSNSRTQDSSPKITTFE